MLNMVQRVLSTLKLNHRKFIRFGTNHHLMQVVNVLFNHRTMVPVCHSKSNYHRHQQELKRRCSYFLFITLQCNNNALKMNEPFSFFYFNVHSFIENQTFCSNKNLFFFQFYFSVRIFASQPK